MKDVSRRLYALLVIIATIASVLHHSHMGRDRKILLLELGGIIVAAYIARRLIRRESSNVINSPHAVVMPKQKLPSNKDIIR